MVYSELTHTGSKSFLVLQNTTLLTWPKFKINLHYIWSTCAPLRLLVCVRVCVWCLQVKRGFTTMWLQLLQRQKLIPRAGDTGEGACVWRALQLRPLQIHRVEVNGFHTEKDHDQKKPSSFKFKQLLNFSIVFVCLLCIPWISITDYIKKDGCIHCGVNGFLVRSCCEASTWAFSLSSCWCFQMDRAPGGRSLGDWNHKFIKNKCLGHRSRERLLYIETSEKL